jgi:hypothetical protein
MIGRKSIIALVVAYIWLGPAAWAGEQAELLPKDTSPAEVVGYVERGAALILELGPEKAFPILTDPKGPWVGGQWYLFVNSFEGFVIAHLNKKLVGKTLLHIKDVKGNAFYAELQRIGQSEKGRGWAKYWWPRADSKEPALKAGFVMRVGKKQMWIGSGVYGLTEDQIDSLIAEQNE